VSMFDKPQASRGKVSFAVFCSSRLGVSVNALTPYSNPVSQLPLE
jgi:hypothetical protein